MASSLLGRMSSDLLLPKDQLDYLIQSAPYRYKVYQVPKRSGSEMRTIAQPAVEIKRLQYWVISNIFQSLAVHRAATAYTKGQNIRKNAQPHTRNPFLLKLDFRNFFPSIKGQDFVQYAHEKKGFDFADQDVERLVKILFWCPKSERRFPKSNRNLQLSIGAPTSPFLSNAIMYRFDDKIFEFCKELEIVYTRYADDMTFSMCNKTLRGQILEKVIMVLKDLPFPRLQINDKKTMFGSKANRRRVTGLILSNEGGISLGRARKRSISACVHHFVTGKLEDSEKRWLRGMLSFARDVEPAFVARLKKKYGNEAIDSI